MGAIIINPILQRREETLLYTWNKLKIVNQLDSNKNQNYKKVNRG